MSRLIRDFFVLMTLIPGSLSAGHPGMVHQPLDISAETPHPEIRIVVSPDSGTGWNLHIQTRHFTFTPEQVGGPHQSGQGHAHVYIDGQKFARVYSNWFYLPRFTAGKHHITVSLNANDHSPLQVHGQAIEAHAEFEEVAQGTKPDNNRTP